MSKTVFILGAGASYSHSTNKESPLINDIFRIIDRIIFLWEITANV